MSRRGTCRRTGIRAEILAESPRRFDIIDRALKYDVTSEVRHLNPPLFSESPIVERRQITPDDPARLYVISATA